MKTLIRLFSKVFKSKKQNVQLSEEQLDAWIVSIRQKPQLSNIGCTVSKKTKPVAKSDDDFEAAGNLVLA